MEILPSDVSVTIRKWGLIRSFTVSRNIVSKTEQQTQSTG